mgnify:CR=1 FL=1
MTNTLTCNIKKRLYQFTFSLILATCSIGFSHNAVANTVNFQALFSGTGEMKYAGGFLCGSDTDFTPTRTTGSMRVGGETTQCHSFNRGAVEFDISTLVDSSSIGSATLSLTTESVYINDTIVNGTVEIGIHGFAGNGVKDKPDFNIDNQLNVFTAAGLTTYTIDVTDYLRTLVGNNDAYAGFMLECLQTSPSCGASNNVYISGISGGINAPLLSIEAVPVPAAFWLFGSGLLGLVGLARRKKL